MTSPLPACLPRFPRITSSLAVLAVCFAFAAPDLRAANDSLLPNGTFEIANPAGDWPQGWGRARHASWETEMGNRFLRLTSPAPGTHVSHFTEVTLPPQTEALELTFRRRVANLVLGENSWYDARIIMNFKLADGKKTASSRLPHTGRDSQGWEDVSLRFRVPPGAISLEFMPSLFRVESGTFDLDNIVLRPIPASAVN